MTQIAIMVYPGSTALDFIGPYEVLRHLPDAEVRFVWHEPGPIAADSGVLLIGATHSFDETPSPDIVLVQGRGQGRPARTDGAATLGPGAGSRAVEADPQTRFERDRQRAAGLPPGFIEQNVS